jgi:hypothetical protein
LRRCVSASIRLLSAIAQWLSSSSSSCRATCACISALTEAAPSICGCRAYDVPTKRGPCHSSKPAARSEHASTLYGDDERGGVVFGVQQVFLANDDADAASKIEAVRLHGKGVRRWRRALVKWVSGVSNDDMLWPRESTSNRARRALAPSPPDSLSRRSKPSS